MKTEKLIIIIAAFAVFGILLASAHEEGNFTEAENIIKQKIQCSQLTNEQLEMLGEYYMEQMHPGESHELMHKMMGFEEGSEAEKQFHISMAKRLYCNEDTGGMMGSGSMMPMMMNMMSGQIPQTNMMGNSGYFRAWNFLNILYIILLIGLIVLVYLWIVKLWKNTKTKGSKK